ncbi:MAG TPA: hypothetical protein VFR97_04370 [Capillimicrobium sp.]|nr:hypothetical protein [Capillimicrobium sp.]
MEIDALLARLPADSPETARIRQRAKTYRDACGCVVAAWFMVSALVLAIVRVATAGDLTLGAGARVGAFVIGAGMAGKALGLLVARARLALLRRQVARRIRCASG